MFPLLYLGSVPSSADCLGVAQHHFDGRQEEQKRGHQPWCPQSLEERIIGFVESEQLAGSLPFSAPGGQCQRVIAHFGHNCLCLSGGGGGGLRPSPPFERIPLHGLAHLVAFVDAFDAHNLALVEQTAGSSWRVHLFQGDGPQLETLCREMGRRFDWVEAEVRARGPSQQKGNLPGGQQNQ